MSNFTVKSATQITATAPPGTAGTDHITVANSGGVSLNSPADQFTYMAMPAANFSGSSPASPTAAALNAVTAEGSDLEATELTAGSAGTGWNWFGSRHG